MTGAPLAVTVSLKGSLPHKVTASMGWGNLSTLRFKMKCLGWPRIISYIYKGIQGTYTWGHLMLIVSDGDRFCLYHSMFQGGFLWCVGERPLPWKAQCEAEHLIREMLGRWPLWTCHQGLTFFSSVPRAHSWWQCWMEYAALCKARLSHILYFLFSTSQAEIWEGWGEGKARKLLLINSSVMVSV